MKIVNKSLAGCFVLSGVGLIGCDRLQERINIIFYGGTTAGYNRCIENNQHTSLSPEALNNQCRSRYAKRLPIKVEGQATYQLLGTARLSGWIENTSKSTVITSYVVRLTNIANKDNAGKPIPEYYSFDGRWIEPGNMDSFETDELKFVPSEPPKKGDWTWFVSEVKGLEIVLR